MKRELVIQYLVKGVRRGGQRAASSRFLELVEVEIEDVLPEDAPLATSWTVPVPREAVMTGQLPGGEDGFSPVERHTLYFRGHHWEPRPGDAPGVSEGIALGLLSKDQTLSSAAYDALRYLGFNDRELKEMRRHRNDPHRLFERIDSSGRDIHVENRNRECSAFVTIGGLLYGRCPEPFIQLAASETRPADGDGEPSPSAIFRVSTEFESQRTDRGLVHHRRYAFSEAGEAYLDAVEFNRENGAGPIADRINAAVRPTVHLPMAIDPGVAVRRRLGDIAGDIERGLEMAKRELVPHTTRFQMDRLRNALAVLHKDGSLEAVEDVFTALAEELAWDRHPQGHLAHHPLEALEVLNGLSISIETIPTRTPQP